MATEDGEENAGMDLHMANAWRESFVHTLNMMFTEYVGEEHLFGFVVTGVHNQTESGELTTFTYFVGSREDATEAARAVDSLIVGIEKVLVDLKKMKHPTHQEPEGMQ